METLPDELTTHVLRYLASEDLVSTALVSKKLASVTASVLYTKCSLETTNARSLRKRLASLLRTLLAQPSLRKTINEIRVDVWPPELPPQGPITSFCEDDIGSLVQMCPTDVSKELDRQLRVSDRDGMSASLVMLAPKLQTLNLHLKEYERPDHGFWMDHLELQIETLTTQLFQHQTRMSMLGHQRLFGNLRSVSLTQDSDRGYAGWDSRVVSLFLSVPSLRRLEVNGSSNTTNGWLCDERTSNVEELSLIDVNLEESVVCKALRSCKALKHFIIARMCEVCTTVNEDFDYSHVKQELLYHRNSLRHLTFYTTSCTENHHVYFPWSSSAGSLAQLHKLESLIIDEDALYGGDTSPPFADLLPQELGILTFVADSDDMRTRSLEFAAAAMTTMPALRAIGHQNADLATVNQLRQKFPELLFEWAGQDSSFLLIIEADGLQGQERMDLITRTLQIEGLDLGVPSWTGHQGG